MKKYLFNRHDFSAFNCISLLVFALTISFSVMAQSRARTAPAAPAPAPANPTPTPTPTPTASGSIVPIAVVPDAENVRKAEQIVQRAVEAMGGATYLMVRTVTARGLFTPFPNGVSGVPLSFIDYVAYPDKNRTEFRGGGNMIIQTVLPDSGWTFDGAAHKIIDAKPEQVRENAMSLRASIDTLLRGGWRKSGENKAVLSYVGRREAGLGRRNETVRLTYADGFAVDFEFNTRDGLPAKAVYKRAIKEGQMIDAEDRFAQFVVVGGVNVPFIIDQYRAGAQSSRVNYQSITFNNPIADSFFARPTDLKALRQSRPDGK